MLKIAVLAPIASVNVRIAPRVKTGAFRKLRIASRISSCQDTPARCGSRASASDASAVHRPNRNRRRFWYPSSELTSPYAPEWDRWT